MEPENPKATSFSRQLTIISVIVLVIFVAVVIGQLVRGHDQAFNHAKKFTERLARIQSNNIEMAFNSLDLGLQIFANNEYYGSLFDKAGYERIDREIKNWVENYPHISWVIISDNQGRVAMVAGKKEYESWAKGKESISDSEFFRRHKIQKTDSKNFLLTTEKSALAERGKLIVISRPTYSYDGSFAGVVAAAVDPEAFFQFTRAIEPSSRARLDILVNNKELIESQESGNGDKSFELLSKNDLNKEQSAKIQVQRLQGENGNYLIAYRSLGNMPVKVAVVVDENWMMADWKSVGMMNMVFLALFIIFGGVLFTLVLAMGKQITRAEESEKKALLANQAKSEFLAKMSHELRTPLNAIIGFSEMIDSGYFGPIPNRKQQERIHDINLCGNHLLNLINDILDYTKGEAGKLELHDSEVSIDKVIDESMRILQDKARKKKITLSTNVPSDLPKLNADERKLKQIFLNLISNAIKFTSANGKIQIGVVINSGGKMEISVEDNGIGMAQEDIPIALSVFGQVRGGRQQMEEEGTGLGLPLCKMLVELHDGEFIIESEVGKGTKVIITMPRERVLNPEKKSTKKKS